MYHGWNVMNNRMFVANGKRTSFLRSFIACRTDFGAGDPWKDATLSAEQHVVASTPQQPIFIGDGFHCSDLIISEGAASEKIKAVQDTAVDYMTTWIAQWSPST